MPELHHTIPDTVRHLWVRRTWLRDHSSNTMRLAEAVANLLRNRPDLCPETALRKLLRGELVPAGLAVMRLVTPDNGGSR